MEDAARFGIAAGCRFYGTAIGYNLKARSSRLMLVQWIQHLQWPAVLATLLSAWLVAPQI